jgi:ATP-dependent DNA helicase RecQ
VSIPFLKNIYISLNQFFQIALGELTEDDYNFKIQEFCNVYNFPVLKTYNALQLLDKEGIIIFNQFSTKKSSLQFLGSSKRVLAYSKTKHSALIKMLLRTYGGIFEAKSAINETHISKKIAQPYSVLKNALKQLHDDGIVIYDEQTNTSTIQFLVMREDDRTINRISKHIDKRNNIKKEKQNAIITYIKTDICRNRQLLNYFEEDVVIDCGICDICMLSKNEVVDKQVISNNIVTLFSENKQWSSKDIVRRLNIKTSIILDILQRLLEMDILKLNKYNKFEKK